MHYFLLCLHPLLINTKDFYLYFYIIDDFFSLVDHVSHLNNNSDNKISVLMTLIEDFEYILTSIDRESKLHTSDGRGILLEQCKNFLLDVS